MPLSKQEIRSKVDFLDNKQDKIKYLELIKERKRLLSEETKKNLYLTLSEIYSQAGKSPELIQLYNRLGNRKTKSEQEVLNHEYKKDLLSKMRKWPIRTFAFEERDFSIKNYIYEEAKGNLDESLLKRGLEFMLQQGLFEEYFDFNKENRIAVDKKILRNALNRLFNFLDKETRSLSSLIMGAEMGFDFKECEKSIQRFYKRALFKEKLDSDYIQLIKNLVEKTGVKPTLTEKQINKLNRRLIRSGELLYLERLEKILGKKSKIEEKDAWLGYKNFLLDYINGEYYFEDHEKSLRGYFSKLGINFRDERAKSITQKIYNKIPERGYNRFFYLYNVTKILPDFKYEKIKRIVGSIIAEGGGWSFDGAKGFYKLFSENLSTQERKGIEEILNNEVINQIDKALDKFKEEKLPTKESVGGFLEKEKEWKREYIGRFPYEKGKELAEIKLHVFRKDEWLKNDFFLEYVKAKRFF